MVGLIDTIAIQYSTPLNLGFFIALTSSLVALYGVWLFNQKRDYTGARVVWMVSNPLFTLYFIGRVLVLWDGGLGDGAMIAYFAGMTMSNLWGMK
jgi:hypothetical protein